MKKCLSLLICMFFLLSSTSFASNAGIVTLTIPAWVEYSEDESSDFNVLFSKINEDGSISIAITEEDQKAEINRILEEYQATVDEMTNDSSGLLSVKSIETGENFSTIDVYLGRNELGLEAFYAISLPLHAWTYQIMNGCLPADFSTTLSFYKATGEVLESYSYADADIQSLVDSLQESPSSEDDSIELMAATYENDPAECSTAGEPLLIDDVCEFSYVGFQIAPKITPENTDSGYSYHEADYGKQYVDVTFTYKNLAAKGINSEDIIDGLLVFREKYEYDGFATVETDRRSYFSRYHVIDPLCTEYLHYLFEVPDEVANSEDSLVANFKIHNMEYKVTIR